MYLPKCFRWYKDRYNRTDKFRVFRYPSPASEPLVEDVDNRPDNYRLSYTHSRYNVRENLAYNQPNDVEETQLYLDLSGLTAEEK
jgi:hypothetical protein